MATKQKQETNLVSKLAGVYNFVCKYEGITGEVNEAQEGLDAANAKLDKRVTAVSKSILWLVLSLASIFLLMWWGAGSVKGIFTGQAFGGTSFLNLLRVLACVVLVLICIWHILKIPVYFLILLPRSRSKIDRCQAVYDERYEKYSELYDEMPDEMADTEELFPDDKYYPQSHHVKYGIDCLKSGRASDFKETAKLIDELAHREKMEREAERQTENTREAARAARSAESAARRAASDASAAASAARSSRY